MAYDYNEVRQFLFTEKGQVLFLKVRDRTNMLIANSGAVRMDKIFQGVAGYTWDILACADRMVELGELSEVTGPDVMGQDRVFVFGPKGGAC